MSSPLVRAAFATLALATIVAFVVAQRLKADLPLVLWFDATPNTLSPNGDGRRERTLVHLELSKRATVSFSIVDAEGREVRRLADDATLRGRRRYGFGWNGRDDDGRLVSDGVYRMRVVRRDEGRVVNSLKEIWVDTRPPAARIASAEPGVVAPGGSGRPTPVRVTLRVRRERGAPRPWFRVFRTDLGRPRAVASFRGEGPRSGVWDGTVARGRAAPEGDYAFSAIVRDAARNRAVAGGPLPSRATARSGTGVVVRRLSVEGPLGVAEAGSLVALRVDPAGRRFEFTLARLGGRRPLLHGGRVGGELRVRVPRVARTGLYELRVQAGRARARWPLAVAGLPAGRPASRPRPLVVLPTLTWQGLNPVDGDLDGFPETLADARSVALERPFASGALPPLLRSQAAPLLRFLDAAGLPYDLTTDVALAEGSGPALGKAPGVAFAGDARWLPSGLERRLRRYADEGGRIASFGADSFRRTVALSGGAARDPSRPRRTNAFGELTALLRTDEAPLVVERDRLGLFRGLDRYVGGFTAFERSLGLPRGAGALTAAGRDPGQPAFVAYPLGRGLVLRAGTPQWGRELDARRLDVEVPRATGRIWRMLEAGA
jgi:FlgD Ig-like domain